MTEDIRITTYCKTIEQKEKIQFLIRNVKEKYQFKKTGDALEFICEKYINPDYEIWNSKPKNTLVNADM